MKLLKFLFILIFIILIIVGIPVGLVFYSLSDTTDAAPIELYEPTITTEEIITPLIKDTFANMGDNYALELGLTEDDLNKLIYAIIKKSINTEYNPKYGTTDKELYINSDIVIPDNITLIGGKKVLIKHAYAEYIDGKIYLNLTADGLNLIQSRFILGFSLTTNADEFILKIEELRLGKISLLTGFGKKIFDSAVNNGIITDTQVNKFLEEKKLPLKFDLSTFSFKSNKKEFGEFISKQLSSEETDEIITNFLDILTNSENDMLHLSTVNDLFSFKINLDKLKVDDSLTTVSDYVKHDIDFHYFAQAKAQNIIFNLMTSNDKRILFTEIEFSQLIYTETQHYEILKFEEKILGDTNLSFKIEGIIIDIEEDNFIINLILNINGLKTVAILKCPITYSDISHTEIHINVPDIVVLGNNLEVNSSFIISLLENTMKDNNVMPFINQNGEHYFKLTAQVFDSFVNNADASTPLHVTKIEFINDSLSVYVECDNQQISDLIDDVTNQLTDILKDEFISTIEFNTSNDQLEAVESITESINNITEKITDPNLELTTEDTDKLINDFNTLSTENQNLFLLGLQEQFNNEGTNDFFDLYNSLFNQGE